MAVTLNVNGASHTVPADGDTPLLYVLRNDLGLSGPKFGCGLGQCGACTVLVDGEAVRSCLRAVGGLGGARVVTLEGLGDPAHPHPLQHAFLTEQAAQCGYCTSGMIMTAAALLARQPAASDAEVRAALEHNVCRCGAQARIVRAVRAVQRAGQEPAR